MSRPVLPLRSAFAVLVATLAVAAVPVAVALQAPPPLTVHEWGTFTTIAGDDGQATQWLPLGGPTDLPCFVETYKNRMYKVMQPPEAGALLDYEKARSGLKGTVRMETPVLYFYADRPTTASVSVTFPQGLFTEYYPYAEIVQAPSYSNTLTLGRSAPARISWNSVSINPGTSPTLATDSSDSHYYAARETDAAPVRVWGRDEKFLFYRGVAGFRPPISTVLQPDGRIRVKNLSSDALSKVIVLTRHGNEFGYQVHDTLAPGAETVIASPKGGTLDALRRDLEQILVAQGLYAREARAMVETWRDDWFNDGTRVFYVVPQTDVDAMLPLVVEPKPASIVRTFVGRMEVVTERSEADVARALATNDARLIEAYGRWLGPIGDRIIAKTANADQKAALLSRLDGIFKGYLTRVTACH
jgi:hypothetical protein